MKVTPEQLVQKFIEVKTIKEAAVKLGIGQRYAYKILSDSNGPTKNMYAMYKEKFKRERAAARKEKASEIARMYYQKKKQNSEWAEKKREYNKGYEERMKENPEWKQKKRDASKKYYAVKSKEEDWKEAHNKRRRDRVKKNKLKAIKYLGGRCSNPNCTLPDDYELHQSAFDFHHKDPSTKKFEIGELLSCSWKKIKVELDKCVLYCSNCHRELHNEDVEDF